MLRRRIVPAAATAATATVVTALSLVLTGAIPASADGGFDSTVTPPKPAASLPTSTFQPHAGTQLAPRSVRKGYNGNLGMPSNPYPDYGTGTGNSRS